MTQIFTGFILPVYIPILGFVLVFGSCLVTTCSIGLRKYVNSRARTRTRNKRHGHYFSARELSSNISSRVLWHDAPTSHSSHHQSVDDYNTLSLCRKSIPVFRYSTCTDSEYAAMNDRALASLRTASNSAILYVADCLAYDTATPQYTMILFVPRLRMHKPLV